MEEDLKFGKLELGLWIGWIALAGIGVVFLTWETFKISWMVGTGFIFLLIIGFIIRMNWKE